ncbi:MAG: GH3 auxin-responsive promoter family protein [Prevotella sp.]|nr:GH3 auxin-responsive promoter family protein [Prevotella sp.]
MKDYKISVVTPFHNTDLGMFRVCVDSMLHQTIGFEQVEWIIVLHNCDQSYSDGVRKMVANYNNVRLLELNCDVHNCSAPRNHGVRMAQGKYIGFLDADDSYLNDCLEVAVRNAEETKSQVVCFRREYEKENESLMTLTETVLWNQLEKQVVVEKGSLDYERMFSGAWPFVTSKIFERRFLIDNNIYQDESIHYMAAVLYSLIALTTADRICYLPQYIGYHYYVNSKSIVQSYDKKSRTIVEYCQGIATTIDEFYIRGIDPNETLQRMVAYVSRFIIYTDMTPEDRREALSILRPYVLKARRITHYKLVDEGTAKTWYRIINDVILDSEDTKGNKVLEDMRSGLDQLHDILAKNSKTDYGEKYHFAEVDTINDYRHHVPITMTDAYRNLINLQINIGEFGILTSDRIQYYCESELGLVPFTEKHLTPYLNCIVNILKGHHTLLIATCKPLGMSLNDDTYQEPLESIITRRLFRQTIYEPAMRDASFTMSPMYYLNDEDSEYHKLAEAAIHDTAITQLVAPTATHMKKFVNEVKRLCGGQIDTQHLWPNLQGVVAYGLDEYYADRQYVMQELNNGHLHWNNGAILLPETVLATSKGDDTDRFILNTDNCFYEFFRIDTDEVREPLLLSQLEEGASYCLIITNDAGIYRLYTDFQITVKSIRYNIVEIVCSN